MRHTILVFGGLTVAILLLFELNKLSSLSANAPREILMVASGVCFILVGILLNRFMYKSPSPGRALKKSKLSKQEHKVLQLITDGLSNAEIAEELSIAQSTVKTHISKILMKLKAKRRTQAVKIGRDLNII